MTGLIEPQYWCLKCETRSCYAPGLCRDCSKHEPCSVCGATDDIISTDGICLSCTKEGKGKKY